MNCTLCHKPVVLHPTAAQRAERYGGTPRDYTILFPRHADCELKAREQGTRELVKRLNSDGEAPDAND